MPLIMLLFVAILSLLCALFHRCYPAVFPRCFSAETSCFKDLGQIPEFLTGRAAKAGDPFPETGAEPLPGLVPGIHVFETTSI
jgi:hypothetical protein